MGNLLRYTDKSKPIDDRLSSLIAQVTHDYNNGIIKTETEYYYRVKNVIDEFYTTLSRPSLKYRPAVTTPVSGEYNAMLKESYNDMQYIIKDCEALGDLVSQSFTDAELGRKMMANELALLSQKINAIGRSISKNQPAGTVVFTELFSDVEHTGNLWAANSCFVNTEEKILTLRRGSRSSPAISKIEIDNETSNGFPGNTHCADTAGSELHYAGSDGMHCSLEAINDGHSDTWFEFELFSVTDETRRACNSYGFTYDEGVSWVNDDDVLRLKLILHLAQEHVCSWISITPYLSDIKGVKNCFLEKCEIITSSNNIYSVAKDTVFDDVLVYPFPPQPVQRIELTFVQHSRYAVKAGHTYYVSADTSDMSIFQDYDYSGMFARIDGEKPSVGLLGCKYDPSSQWVIYPDSKTEMPDVQYVKNRLFTAPQSTLDKKASQELVDAYRYMIGIRGIKVSTCTFQKYGEYVSTVFRTEDIITSIRLDADEYIPGDNNDVLRYYISINGGETWHKIYPVGRAYLGIYKYYVNNNTIENLLAYDTEQKKSRNLSIAGECRSVQVKIEMERPENDDSSLYSTPVVYSYRLKLTTGGETIEY